jgi:DNA-binding beta-propeller fold protein YncE
MKKLRPALIVASAILVLIGASRRLPADTGTCGGITATLPFTDVAGNAFFCQIGEAFFSGLTNGTTSTTYSPSQNVPREQMAAFITRTQDSALRRGSQRAALKRWALPATEHLQSWGYLGQIRVASDGQDVWVTDPGTVYRLQGGYPMEHYDIPHPFALLVISERLIFVTETSPINRLCEIDSGSQTIKCDWPLDANPQSLTTDGTYIWTANRDGGSLSRVNLDSNSVVNYHGGFITPIGILFDGTNIWVNDAGDGKLKKLDSNGNILQSISLNGGADGFPVYDGYNIWIPDYSSSSVAVVRARDGLMLARLTGNGLSGPVEAAFDGERILVTNYNGNSVSLWKAADLTSIGSVSTGAGPSGACSDGIHFFVAAYLDRKVLQL